MKANSFVWHDHLVSVFLFLRFTYCFCLAVLKPRFDCRLFDRSVDTVLDAIVYGTILSVESGLTLEQSVLKDDSVCVPSISLLP